MNRSIRKPKKEGSFYKTATSIQKEEDINFEESIEETDIKKSNKKKASEEEK